MAPHGTTHTSFNLVLEWLLVSGSKRSVKDPALSEFQSRSRVAFGFRFKTLSQRPCAFGVSISFSSGFWFQACAINATTAQSSRFNLVLEWLLVSGYACRAFVSAIEHLVSISFSSGFWFQDKTE